MYRQSPSYVSMTPMTPSIINHQPTLAMMGLSEFVKHKEHHAKHGCVTVCHQTALAKPVHMSCPPANASAGGRAV